MTALTYVIGASRALSVFSSAITVDSTQDRRPRRLSSAVLYRKTRCVMSIYIEGTGGYANRDFTLSRAAPSSRIYDTACPGFDSL
ncbi:hypothetical protein C8Q78DRAFT_1041139 [Trametes maxima]|nr:hypothetical protein C8Q78DRAFT_1041139 [Trametes maxima]